MRFRHLLLSFAAVLPVLAYGCAAPTSDDGSEDGEDAYTSASAKLLDFDFEGEVTMAGGDPQQTIKDQMLFTIGQLNGKTGVGRLDKLAITNVRTDVQGDLTRVRYHAKLPVSIAKTSRVARSYTLILPKRADYAGQEAFFTKYGTTACTDHFAHDNETGIYWYYYRPEQSGCTLAADDVVKARATVRVSPENTTNTYPEYDKL
jgi:hypothetical protein